MFAGCSHAAPQPGLQIPTIVPFQSKIANAFVITVVIGLESILGVSEVLYW